MRNYDALLEYYKEHGTCNVPETAEKYECDLPGWVDTKGDIYYYKGDLGQWLHEQRLNKKFNPLVLTIEQDAKLQLLVDEGKLHSVG